jgi:hypothetical protein
MELPPMAEFVREARAWLDANVDLRPKVDLQWGVGSDALSPYLDTTFEEELQQLDEARDWQMSVCDRQIGLG